MKAQRLGKWKELSQRHREIIEANIRDAPNAARPGVTAEQYIEKQILLMEEQDKYDKEAKNYLKNADAKPVRCQTQPHPPTHTHHARAVRRALSCTAWYSR